MTKTLILQGLDGSPAPHWQQWWAASDPNAILVDLARPDAPRSLNKGLRYENDLSHPIPQPQ